MKMQLGQPTVRRLTPTLMWGDIGFDGVLDRGMHAELADSLNRWKTT